MVVVSYRFQSIVDYLTTNASNFRRSPHVSGSVRKRRFKACFPPDDCAETFPKRLPPPTGHVRACALWCHQVMRNQSYRCLILGSFFLAPKTGFQLTSSNVFRCPSSFLVTRENAVYVGTGGKKGKKYMKISGYVWTKSYGYTSTKKPKVDVQLQLEPASNQAQLTGEEPKATIAW